MGARHAKGHALRREQTGEDKLLTGPAIGANQEEGGYLQGLTNQGWPSCADQHHERKDSCPYLGSPGS